MPELRGDPAFSAFAKLRCFHPEPRHTPRRRGIQYAAAFRFHHRRLWNTGSSAFADDDGRECGAWIRDPAARCARVVHENLRPETEGVGNAGCPLHPQPRVYW